MWSAAADSGARFRRHWRRSSSAGHFTLSGSERRFPFGFQRPGQREADGKSALRVGYDAILEIRARADILAEPRPQRVHGFGMVTLDLAISMP